MQELSLARDFLPERAGVEIIPRGFFQGIRVIHPAGQDLSLPTQRYVADRRHVVEGNVDMEPNECICGKTNRPRRIFLSLVWIGGGLDVWPKRDGIFEQGYQFRSLCGVVLCGVVGGRVE